jgi:Rieske Fe-S protein
MLTRRRMVQALGLIVLLPVAGLWQAMAKRLNSREIGSELQIPLETVPLGVSFGEGYLVFRDADKIIVFSSRCTHLGCQLKSLDKGHPVCSCHGSIFDPKNGHPVRGPAIEPLRELEYKLKDNDLIIKLV